MPAAKQIFWAYCFIWMVYLYLKAQFTIFGIFYVIYVKQMNSNPFIVSIFHGQSNLASISNYVKEILLNPVVYGKASDISL